MTKEELIEVAKSCGAKIEYYMSRTPRVIGVYFTKVQLEEFANIFSKKPTTNRLSELNCNIAWGLTNPPTVLYAAFTPDQLWEFIHGSN